MPLCYFPLFLTSCNISFKFINVMSLHEETFFQMGPELWISKCAHVRNTKGNYLLLEPMNHKVMELFIISSSKTADEGFL